MPDKYPVPLDDLLKLLVRNEGSDLHLRAHEPPVFRIHGELRRTNFPPLTPENIKGIVYPLMGPDRIERYERQLECDLAYQIQGLARFRVNVFKQQNSPGAVMRLIPIRVQTLDELGLPPVLREIAMLPRGLILVTGPTGSGKSTSLAAMVNEINATKPVHIITIEDPIEFMHNDKVAALNQREVEMDTHSFADALKHVMRQNPDVILVGEMRDNETMQLAITLQAVISMTLLPRIDRPGRVAAFEIMIATPAVRNMIREHKTHQLYGAIQTGAEIGMQTLDNHLLQLYRDGIVSFEMALSKSSNPSEFSARVGTGSRPEEMTSAAPGEV
ncbi:MAG: hypothetical protein A2Y74_07845 [Actinobacteria bacterium RBG_13_63_9]|nr:MAG: hypothetical protein A2Y74_07845 [Actinobacteria bacterium RBG_13_63_9]